MTFDEEFKSTFETLTDRLRDEIARHLSEVSADLAASVESERVRSVAHAADEARLDAERRIDEVRQNLERQGEQAREETERRVQEARAEGRADGQAEGRTEGLAEGRAEGQAEANREAEEARAEFERSADVALREAERLANERLIAGVAAADVQARAQARDEHRTGEIARRERLASAIRAIDQARSLSEILDTLVRCAGCEALRAGVLLVHQNELRGWRFVGFPSPLDETIQFQLPSIEAGVIGEAVRTLAVQWADSGLRGSMPSFAELPPGRDMLAVPLTLGGQAVAVLYADQGAGDAHHLEPGVAWPATLEMMARHAARCLEAITTFRAAKVLTDWRGLPSPLPAAAGDHAEGRAADDGADEQAARRFARLLISEIKLYHEDDVAAGHRNRNLSTRLGGEIARARVMFEQRVPATVRQSGDYFHAELVRTLANGDPALLGHE